MWCKSGLLGKIAFELYPVELLHLFLLVGVNEGVQFAIGDAVEHPSVCTQVPRGLRQLDPHRWIVLRYDDIVFNFSLRAFGLGI